MKVSCRLRYPWVYVLNGGMRRANVILATLMVLLFITELTTSKPDPILLAITSIIATLSLTYALTRRKHGPQHRTR